MADEGLRQLERSAAGGDPDAGARLLVERVRSGALPKERLLLAAQLGDPAARAATASTQSPLSATARVAYALSHADGSPRYFRWALDCAERALDAVSGVDAAVEARAARARDALAAARGALETPIGDDERRRALRGSHDLLMETGGFYQAPQALRAVYHAVGTLVDENEVGSAIDAAAVASGVGAEADERAWQAQRLAELLLE